jgi:xylan 1,4-beta-xylosidase
MSSLPPWRASAFTLASFLVTLLACSGRPAASRVDSARKTAADPARARPAPADRPAPRTFANPLDLDYRFSLAAPSRREAADPTVVQFQGSYFLFASKSGGYWMSKDLGTWTFVTAPLLPHEDYAPTAAVIDGWLYFMASSGAPSKIFRSREPERGRWELYNDAFPFAQIDPALFVDDDGRVYLYFGCSNQDPLHVVELDPKNQLNPMDSVIDLFGGKAQQHGWERRGDDNELDLQPWIEGTWMTKHRGKYYLQYAGPGTEFKSYSDGVYVADSPVGPFQYAHYSPFSSKPGGYACGAGHGSTFADEYGNYWHIATMSISVKHMFERRLGLFPASFDAQGVLRAHTEFGDYPTLVPNGKVDDLSTLFAGWMLLSYGKPATASSSLPGYGPESAVDEDIRTYFSATTGDSNEWLSVDLGEESTVHAVQVNFAEHRATTLGRKGVRAAQYAVEHSLDGKGWSILVDRSQNEVDRPHAYLPIDPPMSTRHIRVTSRRVPTGTFAVSGLRVFGRGGGRPPAAVSELRVDRDRSDRCCVALDWDAVAGVSGYDVRYGIASTKLYHSHIVYADSALALCSLNADTRYWFAVDAFNENGITPAAQAVEVP